MYYYVGVVLFKEDGSVLLQNRDNKPGIPSPGRNSFIGGRSEQTDIDLTAAVMRELLEEAGYVALRGDLIKIDEDCFWASGQEVRRVFFKVKYDGTQLIVCGEGESIRFYKPEEIENLDFCDWTHRELSLRTSSEACLSYGREKKS
jgi:8-oxo-dGTP pyrophosphatase MutT (NUDIX family)